MEEIKRLCKTWLFENFGIDGEITSIKIKKQTEFEEELNIMGVEFEFSTPDGKGGDSVAFFDRGLLELSAYTAFKGADLLKTSI